MKITTKYQQYFRYFARNLFDARNKLSTKSSSRNHQKHTDILIFRGLSLRLILLMCSVVIGVSAIHAADKAIENAWMTIEFYNGKRSLASKKVADASIPVLTVPSAVKSAVACALVSPAHARSRESFNSDWQFKVSPDEAREPKNAQTADFDSSSWRTVNLPHDWAIAGPFDMELDGSTGMLPWAKIGWYRKMFDVPASDQGKRIYLDIDGAMANATIYLNGKEIGGRPYGYMPFRTDLTDAIQFGKTNTLAVRLNTKSWGSRWYPGAGLYRNVWLVKTAPVHIERWGVHIQTPEITTDKGVATLDVTVKNHSDKQVTARVHTVIYEYGTDARIGQEVAKTTPKTLQISGGSESVAALETTISNPKLWDLDSPERYLSRTYVQIDNQTIDTYEEPFGFRSLEFTPYDGFKLNGRPVPIQGVCMHHDLGPLGAAFYTRAFERQMEIMKEMGVNAIRTSHNPPAPEVLEVCDRLGMLVQVESFDAWKNKKRNYDYGYLYAEWHERDLSDIVKMGRNHPSVFMWCLGNEVQETHRPEGPGMAWELREIVRRYDTTRPVTVGSNRGEAATNGFQKELDVFGFNYRTNFYSKFHEHPDNQGRIYHGSETSSCLSSRGEYFFPVFDQFTSKPKASAPRLTPSKLRPSPYQTGGDFQMSSYDEAAPGWGSTPDWQFMLMDQNTACLGEFVWTGFDYLGEPTPYNKDITNLLNFSDPEQVADMREELEAIGKIKPPSRSSYFGIVDLCGFKKDRFYLYQSRWRPDLPMAHILPHWNWPERVGENIPIHIYTSGDEAEVFLNGKSLGRKKKGEFEYRLIWPEVVYEPGEVKVVAYKDGKEWATDTMKTTDPASQLAATVDRSVISADGYDLSFVTVEILDDNNLNVPRSHNQISFTIEGPGEIVALGNGNPNSHESFVATDRKAFNGLCLAIIRSVKGQTGAIRLTATSGKLRPAALTIASK
jgi:beta-galactosidase